MDVIMLIPMWYVNCQTNIMNSADIWDSIKHNASVSHYSVRR